MIVGFGFKHQYTPRGEPNCDDRSSVLDTLMNGSAKPGASLYEFISGHFVKLMA